MLACSCVLCLNLLISLSICFCLLSPPSSHSCSLSLVLGFAFFPCWLNTQALSFKCRKKDGPLQFHANQSIQRKWNFHTPHFMEGLWLVWTLPLASTNIYRTGTEKSDGPDSVICPLLYGGMGKGRLEALLQMDPPESCKVDKEQLSTDTTCGHKNGSELHKQGHVITIGLSYLFISKPAHPGPCSLLFGYYFRKKLDVDWLLIVCHGKSFC